MLIIIFLVILLFGLAWFFIVFWKESKGAPLTGKAGVFAAEMPGHGASVDLIEMKAMREASDNKVARLEKLVDEKNRLIIDLQKGSFAGQDQSAQVDQLKGIFQEEIEGLKRHNKQLKEDLSAAQQEIMDLQTRLYAADAGKGASSLKIGVMPAASPDQVKATVLVPPEPVQPKVVKPGVLSLHDIFGGEKNG